MKKELLDSAFKAMENSYAPYSNYHVGSAFLMKDGTIFQGANVENASYGASNCGERSAIFAAYSNGYREKDIVACAIVTDGKILAGPCGICRQVLSELMGNQVPIYLSNGKDSMDTNMETLMPFQFGKKDLDEL